MKLTNAIVYKAEIPVDPVTLHNHLAKHSFEPPAQQQPRSWGFVPVHNEAGCSLVETFPGGLAFTLRVDDKVMPGAVVRAETKRRIENVKKHFGRKPGKKERAQIKGDVIADLLAIAMVKTTAVITCFYHVESGYLIVPVTNQKLADLCTSAVIQAVESVKTQTVHVADVKHGLTTRLKAWLKGLGDLDAFGTFHPCDQVHLKLDKRSVAVRMSNLESAHKGLVEALGQGFTVAQIGLAAHGYDFRLSADFKLRGITHNNIPDESEDDAWWPIQAEAQVTNVVNAITELLRLLSYREPEKEDAEPVTEVTQ